MVNRQCPSNGFQERKPWPRFQPFLVQFVTQQRSPPSRASMPPGRGRLRNCPVLGLGAKGVPNRTLKAILEPYHIIYIYNGKGPQSKKHQNHPQQQYRILALLTKTCIDYASSKDMIDDKESICSIII